MPRVLPHHRLRQRRHLPCRSSQGMALPIALGGSLLLLLSSGSLQLLALQSRAQVVQQQRRLQLEDTLASAAQQQLAALQAAGAGCLLTVDQAQWAAAASACAISPEQLAGLQQGELGQSAYRLSRYQVTGSDGAAPVAEMELQLIGSRPWRAAYRLSLAAAGAHGLQITALQELGLRGAQA